MIHIPLLCSRGFISFAAVSVLCVNNCKRRFSLDGSEGSCPCSALKDRVALVDSLIITSGTGSSVHLESSSRRVRFSPRPRICADFAALVDQMDRLNSWVLQKAQRLELVRTVSRSQNLLGSRNVQLVRQDVGYFLSSTSSRSLLDNWVLRSTLPLFTTLSGV